MWDCKKPFNSAAKLLGAVAARAMAHKGVKSAINLRQSTRFPIDPGGYVMMKYIQHSSVGVNVRSLEKAQVATVTFGGVAESTDLLKKPVI